MSIKRVKTEVVTKHMYCECGGEMKQKSELVMLSYPPLYHHVCDKCGRSAAYTNIYPRIVYEEVESEN